MAVSSPHRIEDGEMPWTVPADAQVVRYLEESLRRGRLSHAYLFSGPPGVGVMALARQLAQALLCVGPEPPCGDCRHCRRIEAETHADILVVRPSATGAIGIEAIRDLQSAASLQPFEARGKVLIVDGAEAMTRDAANALLKLLEEPPDGVTLLLVTANEEAIPDTVRSRCQALRLRPLPFARVAQALREKGVEPAEAERLARMSGGRLEAALLLSEDAADLDARREALEQLLEIGRMPPADRLRLAGRLADGFFRDRETLLNRLDLWTSLWRDALLIASGAPEGVTDPALTDRLAGLSASVAEAAHGVALAREAQDALRRNANPRLAVEALLLALPMNDGNAS